MTFYGPVRRKAVTLCAALTAVINLTVIVFVLHTHPPRYTHSHGGLLPAQMVVRWSDAPCHPRLRGVDPPGVVTALASVPGSGNTWLRHLLQQATGLITGSRYNDYFLQQAGFPGEGVTNGSALVVKTHEGVLEVRRHFRRAVLLVRPPRDAILAEFHRVHGGHVGHATEEDFRQHWEAFWPRALDFWVALNLEWSQFSGPLHVVRFQDLQRDLNATLTQLLGFLGVPYSVGDLQCALKHNQNFKRRSNHVSFRFDRNESSHKDKDRMRVPDTEKEVDGHGNIPRTAYDDVFSEVISRRVEESEEKVGTALMSRDLKL